MGKLGGLMTMLMLIAVVIVTMPFQTVEAKSKVKLNTTKKTMQVGKTETLTLKNAKNVKWKCNKKSVVSLKKKGKNKASICAKKVGKATVVAAYKGKKYKCVVTVRDKQKKEKVSVEEDNPTLNATSIDLYYKSNTYSDLEPQDSKYIDQFQFKVMGTKKKVKIWDLEGENADFFKLDQNGQIKTAGCPDYNVTITVTVKVKLTDGTILKAEVRLHALRDYVINQKIKSFRDTYITSDMSDQEKISKVA